MHRPPVLFSLFLAAAAHAARLTSPDGRLTVDVDLAADGSPRYSVTQAGSPLIAPSGLGLLLKDAPFGAFGITGESSSSADETWTPVCGERASVRNHYNETTLRLREREGAHREMDLVFRAYDEGVAFRYGIPGEAGATFPVIAGEVSEFRFPADHTCFSTTHAQGIYSRVNLSRIPSGTERPLTVDTGAGFVALAEAGLDDFSRMKFKALKDGAPGVVSALGGPATVKAPFLSPWRVIMTAPTPGKLLENNFLIENLNPPCAIADTSWIKPGTVLREISLTTEGGIRTADFCAEHGIAYMLFDAGWYGDEWRATDASRVNVDPKRSKGPLDLRAVIAHAEKKGVGVILYVNALAMSHGLEKILPIYRAWGVKGVKYGFVPVGGQAPTAFISRAIRLAAENRLMVDIHDEWRPTGQTRTWPNLMTAEGIRGDEEADRSNAQSITALFTRFLAGPADNTVCYFDKRVDRLCDHAYQLGKSVCCFSPWQFLFWYDRPAPAGVSLKSGDNLIGDEPELGFFKRLPTAWDDTRVLAGGIGEFAVIARRSGDTWRVGGMNAATPREAAVKLDFLKPGAAYEAVVYTNDPATPTRTHVKIERRRVSAADELRLSVGKNSGFAVEIFPETK